MSDTDEVFKLSPWNENNKLLTKKDVYNFFKKCGISNVENVLKINNLAHYQTAFVHKSYCFKENDSVDLLPNTGCLSLFDEDYENMEFLGDRCLELSAAYYLYRKYPNSDQGFKTTLKAKLVKKASLAKYAEFLGFQPFLIISKHIEEKTQTGRNNPRILEDVFEAFIAAIFLDQNSQKDEMKFMENIQGCRVLGPGWNVVNCFVENLFEKCIDFEDLVLNQENFKEVLLQFYQREFKITPKYLEVNTEGPPHERIFTMGVLDKQGKIIAKGKGKSKRDGEQEASRKALEYFEEIQPI